MGSWPLARWRRYSAIFQPQAQAAHPGEIVQLFATGQGPLDRAVADGASGPTDPLAQTPAAPLVFFGAEPAEVIFSGGRCPSSWRSTAW
ncbi:MAG: hypothetical protein LAP87_29070 [Acidobacteriia bacterium]|nr:hypothetical protein [Terriglobia bacterium]